MWATFSIKFSYAQVITKITYSVVFKSTNSKVMERDNPQCADDIVSDLII